MTNIIKDTTDKLVYGHEGWLEDYVFHYHAGDSIMTMLKWGHNMECDGLPRIEELSFKTFAPDGTQEEVQVKETGKEYLDLTSETDQEGMYIFSIQYDNCYAEYPGDKWKKGNKKDNPDAVAVNRYVQSATNCIFVGHGENREVFDAPLLTTLLPVSPEFVAGHELTFVLKTDGKPQACDDIDFIFKGEGEKTTEKLSTGEDGVLKITPKEPGVYGLIARYVLDGDSDDYDNIHYTATHCFRVKEHGGHDH